MSTSSKSKADQVPGGKKLKALTQSEIARIEREAFSAHWAAKESMYARGRQIGLLAAKEQSPEVIAELALCIRHLNHALNAGLRGDRRQGLI